MRIRVDSCEERSEDVDILMAITLGRTGARRAALLAARIAAIVAAEANSALLASTIGEAVRAAETLELLLVDDPCRQVRLGVFLDRFVSLRSILAANLSFRLSVVDFSVDFALARAVAYILCDLVEVVERMEAAVGPEIRIAVDLDEGSLLLAMSAEGFVDLPVCSFAGSKALKRAEDLIQALGGTIARGVERGEMLFGIGLPVIDA